MSTTAPPPEDLSPAEAAGPVQAPAVVAVVVTRNPGPFLEEALAALEAQDYASLSVLVVDAGSTEDPTARVAAAHPSAFVRRVAGAPGFGGAANEALAAVQGATFFLVCHDDLALDPPAVRVMVEEAFRSNAAIVGPKIVRPDNPEIILEVGRAIDRLGGSHTGIEPGEVDQEQHDAVRDVFYVSSAAMLVRADLFDELQGFDPEAFPGSEDLDLCWRARLAGARVIVAPDARGRHHEAAGQRGPDDRPDARDLARSRVRTVLIASSFTTLLRVVPLALIVTFLEAIVLALTPRRGEAIAGFRGWVWNLLHFGRLRPARRRAQALRRVHDSDLRELQVGAGTRLGSFLSQHHAEDRMQSIGERGRDAFESFMDFMRHPGSLALTAFFVLVLVGSRKLFSGGVPPIGTFASWPDVGALGAEATSAWRHTGLGSTAAPPPALAMMTLLGGLLVGATGLAQTLLIVGAFVVGAVGAYRLAKMLDAGLAGASVTALVYGVSAVPRNAVAHGRLGALVVFALAPFIVVLVTRAGGFSGLLGPGRRPLLGLAMVTALAGAWYPPAALIGVAIGVAFVLSACFVGGISRATRSLGAALVGIAGAAVMLLPWSGVVVDASDDTAALGFAFRPDLGLGELLRFETGPNGAGLAAWGLLVAAVAALLVNDGPRLVWAVRAWAIAIVGYLLVQVPAQLSPDTAVPAPEAGLALAALGIALAAGLGISGISQHVAAKRARWQRLVGVVAVVGVALGSFGFAGDVFDGRWRAPHSWAATVSFAADNVEEGQFRILWVGDAAVLPLDPVEVDTSLSWSLTRNGPADATELLRAPITDADDVVGRAVLAARAGKTSRLGRMLAPLGIRYVAYALREGPGGELGRVPPGIEQTLDGQLDLARLGSPRGLALYENLSWAPVRAFVTGTEVPTGRLNPVTSAVGIDLSGARALGSRLRDAGTVLLSEAFDDGWTATVDGDALAPRRAFGVTNAFAAPSAGAVSVEHSGQGARYLWLLAQIVLWAAALFWWSRGRRRARAPRARRQRDDRPTRTIDEFELGEDDDDFWMRA